MTRRRKAKIAAKTGKVLLEHPNVRHAAATVAVPVAKRRLRRRARRASRQIEHYGAVARTAGNAVVEHAPTAAKALGLYESPKRKRTGPRLGAGILIGAIVMYFLDPASGSDRRAKLSGAAS